MKKIIRLTIALGFPLGFSLGGASATAAPTTGMNVGILRPLLQGDARMLWMGDSFSIPSRARVPFGTLETWPVSAWTAMSASFRGDWLPTLDETADGLRMISASDGFLILREEDPNSARFGLPIFRLHEIHGDASLAEGPGGLILRHAIRDGFIAQGVNGRFIRTSDRLRARLLYLAPPAPTRIAQGVRVFDGGVNRLSFDPAAESRPFWSLGQNPGSDAPGVAERGQINAAPVDVSITPVLGNTQIGVGLDPGFAGSNRYYHPAGAVVYKTDAAGARLPGLYFSTLADASWKYVDFGRNVAAGQPGAPGNQKTFSLEQLTRWLDVTTLDRAQPLYVFYYLDAEQHSFVEARMLFERMIDQTQAAADAVGLAQVRHCLVIPHFHRTAEPDPVKSASNFKTLRDAAFAIASERPNVAAASIFDETDGVLFDGSPAARNWLDSHGFGTFRFGGNTVDLSGPAGLNGDLLDTRNVHPINSHAAAFFGRTLLDIITPSSCPGDLNRDDVVDALDLTILLSTWGTRAAPAEINGDGIVDSVDLTIQLSNWGVCP